MNRDILGSKPYTSSQTDGGANGWYIALGLVELGKSIVEAAKIIADSKKELR